MTDTDYTTTANDIHTTRDAVNWIADQVDEVKNGLPASVVEENLDELAIVIKGWSAEPPTTSSPVEPTQNPIMVAGAIALARQII